MTASAQAGMEVGVLLVGGALVIGDEVRAYGGNQGGGWQWTSG